ncbi:MAG: cell division protein ZipA, partial [Coxiella sp. (in: Bacteria)]
MTFIIALGVIIILLCSASVLKLMQPKAERETRNVRRKPNPPKKVTTKRSVGTRKVTPTVTQKVTLQEPILSPVAENTPATTAPAVPMISVNLMAASDKPYAGYELLQALLSCGLRFGNRNIFHRHLKKTGVGPILFSVASCTKEGTFDLSKIGGFTCNGLVLFMKPSDVDDPVKVFETMLDTADQLITELGGKVLNERQQLLKKEDVIAVHQSLQQL